MPGPLSSLLQRRTILIVVAAPGEAAAIRTGLRLGGSPAPSNPCATPPNWPLSALTTNIDLLETGVGKVNAAAAVALRADPDRHALILNLGIAGALLPLEALPLGSAVLATSSAYADEGILTPTGFQTIPDMGFPLGPFAGTQIPAHPALLAGLTPLAHMTGAIATVSTCSGTDSHAASMRDRTSAIAEAMEGAAIAHTLARLHPAIPFAEMRIISNSTGDRARQCWDIPLAFRKLAELTAAILAH